MLIRARKNILFRMTAVVIGFWVLSVSAAESIYKWIDEDGNIHFSDHPPTQVNKAEKLAIETAPGDDVVREAQEERKRLRTIQKANHDQRTAAREQERQQAELERVRRDDRQRRCDKAHEEIQSLEHHMPIYYIDETGSQVFLEDKERADLISFYRRELAMFCE